MPDGKLIERNSENFCGGPMENSLLKLRLNQSIETDPCGRDGKLKLTLRLYTHPAGAAGTERRRSGWQAPWQHTARRQA